MAYEYEVFVSYRRSSTAGPWVQQHLVPRLQERLNEVCGESVRISCDVQMDSGALWPEELKRRLRASKLLLAVWAADYFRSPWCMAEWQSFKKREQALNMFSADNPQGLVYPIRYNDGDHFHPEARLTQCLKDFTRHNCPDPAFRMTERYVEFDDLVKTMAEEMAAQLGRVPEWNGNFPIEQPPAMDPPRLLRPKL